MRPQTSQMLCKLHLTTWAEGSFALAPSEYMFFDLLQQPQQPLPGTSADSFVQVVTSNLGVVSRASLALCSDSLLSHQGRKCSLVQIWYIPLGRKYPIDGTSMGRLISGISTKLTSRTYTNRIPDKMTSFNINIAGFCELYQRFSVRLYWVHVLHL